MYVAELGLQYTEVIELMQHVSHYSLTRLLLLLSTTAQSVNVAARPVCPSPPVEHGSGRVGLDRACITLDDSCSTL